MIQWNIFEDFRSAVTESHSHINLNRRANMNHSFHIIHMWTLTSFNFSTCNIFYVLSPYKIFIIYLVVMLRQRCLLTPRSVLFIPFLLRLCFVLWPLLHRVSQWICCFILILCQWIIASFGLLKLWRGSIHLKFLFTYNKWSVPSSL